ncbi:hypothetical protein [Deinococcus aestuarii]|uniref:hypothetical protein n=1 Tax=Deinococcus aestuarii TaxID=2774531 RepID=UPI001C0ADE6B|nr:hypothetical protein [Deinococcus aestuarii]
MALTSRLLFIVLLGGVLLWGGSRLQHPVPPSIVRPLEVTATQARKVERQCAADLRRRLNMEALLSGEMGPAYLAETTDQAGTVIWKLTGRTRTARFYACRAEEQGEVLRVLETRLLE